MIILKRILYVLHSGMTGGTFLTTKDLMCNLENKYEILLLGGESDSLRLYKFLNNSLYLINEYPRNFKLRKSFDNSEELINQWSAKEFHNSWLTYIYFEILTKYDIDLIHIMHLINHSFDLPQVANKLGIPVILSIHDFYFLCPFYTLLDENNQYCGGHCSNNDENCYVPWNILDDIDSKKIISEWRDQVCNMFLYIDYFIAPSDFTKDLFLYFYNQINENKFKVIEHGRDFPKITKTYFEKPNTNAPIKILCLANNLDLMKGSEVIKNIKKEDENNSLEFHFMGNCTGDLNNYGISHGKYGRKEFYDIIYNIKPSFIGIFSVWPESFCHTLTEAWSCQIPVLGSNIGVVKDRIIKNNGGWLIDINDSKKSYNLIIDISNDLKEYCGVVKNLKAMNFKSISEMVQEYVEIYNGVK